MSISSVAVKSGPFRIVSVDRSIPPDTDLCRTAQDGTLCSVNIEQFVCVTEDINTDVSDLKLEICSPFLERYSPPTGVSLQPGLKLCLRLGHAPDLVDLSHRRNSISHPTLRSVLEHAVHGSRPGEVLIATVEYKDRGQSPVEDNQTYRLRLRVNDIVPPPICLHEDNNSDANCHDPLVNLTNLWNPDIVYHWFYRAWDLKQRGTWLIRKHDGKFNKLRKGSVTDTTIDDSYYFWLSAFICYSRSLQLLTLARCGHDTCENNTTSSSDINGIEFNHSKFSNNEGIFSSNAFQNTIDVDHDKSFSFVPFIPTPESVLSLEFSLLINLALCQLKAGSAHYAVQNCSQAMSLDPGWIVYLESREANKDAAFPPALKKSLITGNDIVKCLYRRAHASSSIGQWEEAQMDLQLNLRLLKIIEGVTVSSVNANEALLAQVCHSFNKEQSTLVKRLRKRDGLFQL